ncbi:MAG: site-specific DNA-methyltransferase [Cytophagales bacterium]|nr:site-specific DNA-methyltransferase [Cytophagales bacterium]
MNIDLIKFNTNEKLSEYFVKEYSINNKPIPISFRDLIPKLNNIGKYTHLIHSYPAKLIAHIPNFFLNNNYFSKKGDVVLDPFCGTGTVLLEALISGRNAIGADANPLAQLITKVKTTYLTAEILQYYLGLIIQSYKRLRNPEIPDIINRDFWFPLENQKKLGLIKRAIKETTNDEIQDFFLVCFSNCVKKVSYADPRVAVPVKLNPKRYPEGSAKNKKALKRIKDIETIDVFALFETICINNIHRISNLQRFYNKVNAKVISDDARKLTKGIGVSERIENESVDLIITSPPYAGAQKYIRSSSLNLGWIGMVKPNELKFLDKKNIGRENYNKYELKKIETGISSADMLLEKVYSINKLRAYIVGNYLIELMPALNESIRVLKKNSYLILIVGNNKVSNFEFNTQQYLTEYLISRKLSLEFKLIDDIKSYGLMTKRNKTADIISREWILVFKK